jgi:DNA (cytosine-5)-methyltransferase 1
MTPKSSSHSDKSESFWRPKKNGLVSIDLFSGSGGLSLGLHSVGWQGLFAVEKDPMAFSTLENNFLREGSPFKSFEEWPLWLEKKPHDIIEMLNDAVMVARLKKLRGKIDLVAGGPPCQGFSIGGARRGQNDIRNDLPYRFVDFVSIIQPKMILLENVEGFDKPFTHQGHTDSYAEIILKEFVGLGYTVIKTTLHAVDYGVPQTRRRVVLFGIRGNWKTDQLKKTFELLLQESAQEFRTTILPETIFPVGSFEAISDLNGHNFVPSPDAPRFQTAKYLSPKSEYAKLMRAFTSAWTIPDSHRFGVHTAKVLKLIKSAQSSQPAGRLSRKFLQSMGTQSRKKFLLDPKLPVSTLTSHPDEFFHYKDPRIITLREAARLQSFPDAFTFHGRYTLNGDRRGLDVSRCAQIGNAIPPLMGRALGQAMERISAISATSNLGTFLTEVEPLNKNNSSI